MNKRSYGYSMDDIHEPQMMEVALVPQMHSASPIMKSITEEVIYISHSYRILYDLFTYCLVLPDRHCIFFL